MRVVPIKDQTEYAVEDADITLQLKEHFTKDKSVCILSLPLCTILNTACYQKRYNNKITNINSIKNFL